MVSAALNALSAPVGRMAPAPTEALLDQTTCFIHPDRPTRVTCSNCGRPICPDDMTPAPVGYHCPICTGRMRDSDGAVARTSYRTRAEIERRADRVPLARAVRGASVTQGVIAVNVVVFLLMFATGQPTSARTLVRFGALLSPLPRAEWWRMLTAMFVHIGLAHIALNMFALMIFGPALEQRYGKARFLALYLAAGVLGNAFSLTFTQAHIGAGASGGVFGILGAWLAFFLMHRHIASLRGQLSQMLFLIGFNIVLGIVIPNIDIFAHLGGLAAGFVIAGSLEISAAKFRGAARRLAWLAALVVALVVSYSLALPHTI